MRIRDVKAHTVRIPLPRPLALGGLVVHEREYVVVRVECEEGLVGVGLGFTRSGPIADVVLRNLKPLLVGRDPLCTSRLWSEMYESTRYNGRKGLVMRAISAVDIALWDIKGQIANLPLYKLLGGHRDRVPVLATGGYVAVGSGEADLAEDMRRYASQGFTSLKLMVGMNSYAEDLRRVALVREAIGPDIDLGVDVNGVWTDWKGALDFVRSAQRYRLAFVEEPFSPDNAPAMARFAQHCPVPVAMGEAESGRWAYRDLLTQGLVDVLRHDATLVGGVTEWMRVAALGAAFDVPVLPHWFPEIHVHLACAVPNTMAVEWIAPELHVMGLEAIIPSMLQPEGGYVRPPERPGLGLEVDWNGIQRFEVT